MSASQRRTPILLAAKSHFSVSRLDFIFFLKRVLHSDNWFASASENDCLGVSAVSDARVVIKTSKSARVLTSKQLLPTAALGIGPHKHGEGARWMMLRWEDFMAAPKRLPERLKATTINPFPTLVGSRYFLLFSVQELCLPNDRAFQSGNHFSSSTHDSRCYRGSGTTG